MKGIRTAGAALLAGLALVALAPAAASAVTLPEVGRCTKLPEAEKGKGKYTAANCVTKATKPANYEWKAIEGSELIEVSALGGDTKLMTPGHPTITCKTTSFTGHYLTSKTVQVKALLSECTNPIAQTCQTNITSAGVIEPVPLEGELGFIRNEPPAVSVGIDLKPQAPLTTFAVYSCGTSVESTTIEGSVIPKIKPLNKMSREWSPVFAARPGEQLPPSFVGGPTDILKSVYGTPPTTTSANTGWRAKLTGSTTSANSDPTVEIKAVEK